MADKRNYIVGDYEAVTGESVGTPIINVWNYFELDGIFKFELADVVLKQGGVAIPAGNYELAIDTLYTTKEIGNSDKTIYAMWRVTNAVYAGIATTVDGSNFGTMTDNEAIYNKFLNLSEPQDISGDKRFLESVRFEKTLKFLKSGVLNWEAGRYDPNDWFAVVRYDSLGALIDIPFYIDDATGKAHFLQNLMCEASLFCGGIIVDNGAADGGDIIFSSTGFADWYRDNQNGAFRTVNGTTLMHYFDNITGNATYTQNLNVGGTLSKTAGTFDIPHVLPELNDNTGLRHSFVESPVVANMYYDTTKLKNGKATINIDKNFKMTEGTFLALNTDFKYFTKNEDSFVRTISELKGNILTIEAEDPECSDNIYWEIKCRRHDKYIMECDITDKDGNLIVEYKMEKTLEEQKLEERKDLEKRKEKLIKIEKIKKENQERKQDQKKQKEK